MKSENGKISLISIIIAIVLVAVGILIGYLLFQKGDVTKEASEKNTVETGKTETIVQNNISNTQEVENEVTNNETNNNTTQSNGKKNNAYNDIVKNEYLKIVEDAQKEFDNSGNEYGKMVYGLVYFNNDDIPDLAVCNEGYWVSLYIYENGEIHNPIDSWAYGAMGNAGYDYLEKKGIILNYNSDMAGAIRTQSFSILNSDYKFDELSSTQKGADIDDEEMIKSVEEALNSYGGYYYNGEKINEKKYNETLEKYSLSTSEEFLNKFETLFGDKSYSEIKQELSK